MVIDDRLIDYLEELSRLALNAEEKERAKKDLAKIIMYMDKLNELDTTAIEAATHPFNDVNCFREDTAEQSKVDLLANAVAKKEGYFKTAKALE